MQFPGRSERRVSGVRSRFALRQAGEAGLDERACGWCFDPDLARRIHAVSYGDTRHSEAKIAAEFCVRRGLAEPAT